MSFTLANWVNYAFLQETSTNLLLGMQCLVNNKRNYPLD